MIKVMDLTQPASDRVRRSTPDRINERIDRETAANISRYRNATPQEIRARIADLDKEWDIERTL